jgi:hypothetical protein
MENFSIFKNLFGRGAMRLCKKCFSGLSFEKLREVAIAQCELCGILGFDIPNYFGDPRKPPQRLEVSLCIACFDPVANAVVVAGESAFPCEGCNMIPKMGRPKCYRYPVDPRHTAEVDLVAWRNLKPIRKGMTRHPAIPLACIEFQDAASFMKGGPIPQKNFDPFGESGST